MKLRLFVGALVSVIATNLSACTIGGLEHKVRFRPGDPVASASEVHEMVDWYLEKRDGSQGVLEAYVDAIWPETQPMTEKLAQARATFLFELVRSLSTRDPVPVYKRVSSADDGPRLRGAFDTVTVGNQPVCLKTNSCCGGEIQR